MPAAFEGQEEAWPDIWVCAMQDDFGLWPGVVARWPTDADDWMTDAVGAAPTADLRPSMALNDRVVLQRATQEMKDELQRWEAHPLVPPGAGGGSRTALCRRLPSTSGAARLRHKPGARLS